MIKRNFFEILVFINLSSLLLHSKLILLHRCGKNKEGAKAQYMCKVVLEYKKVKYCIDYIL